MGGLRQPAATPQIALQIHGFVGSDGSARLSGAIRLNVDGAKSVLVPVGGTAQATCASAAEGGSGGLVAFQATLQDVRTGERVLMTIDTGQEIIASGIYPVRIEVGDTTASVPLRVRVMWR